MTLQTDFETQIQMIIANFTVVVLLYYCALLRSRVFCWSLEKVFVSQWLLWHKPNRLYRKIYNSIVEQI